MKPACVYCNKPVLVSKQSSLHGNAIDDAGAARPYAAHNDCISEFMAERRWNRLLEACGGDTAQAKRVLGAL